VCGAFRSAADPDRPCRHCARILARPAAPWRCHDCGKESTGDASRCPSCTRTRFEAERRQRERVREQTMAAPVRAAIVSRVAGGEPLTEACRALGVSVQRAWAAARHMPDWARELDDALMGGRPERLPRGAEHATPVGYKMGCRCPECRQAKREQGW
jgi:predicted Zn-ribbon and HTH transcriptional regulator